MHKTRIEIIQLIEQWEGDTGLTALPIEILASWCQALGQSGRGSKPELIKRLLKQAR